MDQSIAARDVFEPAMRNFAPLEVLQRQTFSL
jgi:hypothetical protein